MSEVNFNMYNDDDFKDEEEEVAQSENKILDFYYANKKLIWILGGIIIFILIASLFMGGGNDKPITPAEPDLVISSYNEKLSIGNSVQLFASVNGDETAIFNWSSSNPDVATVSNTGVVQGLDYGTAIITVTYTKNGKTYSEKCEVIVAEGNPNVSITGVTFQKGEVMISVGDTFKLPVIVTPTDGYKKSITFTSYNKDVVSVDEEGLIKAIKTGKATIKVTVNNEFTSDINVHVVDEKVIPQIVINPTNIEFLDNLLKIEVGESVELEYDFQPIDITLSSLVWKSSNETIATVNNGIVTGVKVGKTEITVEALNGITDTIIIEVVPLTIPVESVQILSETNITLNVGGASTIIANVTPADATNKTLSYQSSNSSVVTVDNSGNIKAVGAGNARITVISVDGGKTASVNVVVNSNNSSGGSSGSSSSGSSGSSSGSTSNQEKEACYLVGGEYKWTTKSQALKEDSNAIISSSRDTKEKCEFKEESTIVNNKLSGTITNLAGPNWPTKLVNDEVKITANRHFAYMYYCISDDGNCNIDFHTTNSAKTSYSLVLGRSCYVGDSNKTHLIKFTTTGNSFTFCLTGNKGNYVSIVVEYTDGTKSEKLDLQLK